MKYRYKASGIEVRAFQLLVGVTKPFWAVDIVITEKLLSTGNQVTATIKTLDGDKIASKYNWIVKDQYGHFHVWDEYKFSNTFELVPGQEPKPVEPGLPPPVEPGKPDPAPPGDDGDSDTPKDPDDPKEPGGGDDNKPSDPKDPAPPVNPGEPDKPSDPKDPAPPVNPGEPDKPEPTPIPVDSGNPGSGDSTAKIGSHLQILIAGKVVSADIRVKNWYKESARNPNWKFYIHSLSPIRIFLNDSKTVYYDTYLHRRLSYYHNVYYINNTSADNTYKDSYGIVYKINGKENEDLKNYLESSELWVDDHVYYIEKNDFNRVSLSKYTKNIYKKEDFSLDYTSSYGKKQKLENISSIYFSTTNEIVKKQNSGDNITTIIPNIYSKYYSELYKKDLEILINENFYNNIIIYLENNKHSKPILIEEPDYDEDLIIPKS